MPLMPVPELAMMLFPETVEPVLVLDVVDEIVFKLLISEAVDAPPDP